MELLARIALVFLLVGMTGFFVVAEYALVTSRSWRLAETAEGGSRGAATALRLMEQPMRFIGTVQVAISALAILLGALGEPTIRKLLEPQLATALSFVLAVAFMTYLVVTLGELVPKSVALQDPERAAALVAVSLGAIQRVLGPLVWVLEASAGGVLRLLGLRPVPTGVVVRTEADLRGIVGQAEETGVIEQAEEELLYRVFAFADAEVRDVMVPRPEVVALSADLSMRECLAKAIDSPFSRHPVYRGTLDRIIGIAHIRDLFTAHYEQRIDDMSIEEIARPAYVVPEAKDVAALLRELRHINQHMAIVVDEYGGTAGIVTLEDLLEEIVGEITDEYDLPDESVRWVDERTAHVAGTFTIDDFNEEFGVSLPEEGFQTLAGLVFHHLGRAPVVEDQIPLEGLRFRVLAVEGPRIKLLEACFERAPGPAGAAGRVYRRP